MKKILTKYGLFGTILVFLVLWSCKEDDFHNHQQQTHQNTEEITMKTISVEEFNTKLNSMKRKPDLQRHMKSSQGTMGQKSSGGLDFVIHTDDIREIKQGDYTSYTMYLETPDTIKRNLYNITLEEKGEYTFLLITKYSGTNDWLENSSQEFQGTVSTYRTAVPNIEEIGTSGSGIEFASWTDELEGVFNDGGSTTTTTYPYDCNGYVETTTIITEVKCGCGHTWQDFLGGMCTGSTCGAPIYPSLKTEYVYKCIENTNVGVNPGNTPVNGGPGSNPNNGNSEDSPNDFTDNLTSITTPVVKDPHIGKLNNITNNAVIRTYINNYRDNLDYPFEEGMEFDINNSYFVPQYQESNRVKFFPVSQNNPVTRAHKHHDGLHPIFSAEDVLGMMDFFNEKKAVDADNAGNITLLLVSKTGVHAFRVSSIAGAEDFSQYYYNNNNMKQKFIDAYEAIVISEAMKECNCTNGTVMENLLFDNFIKFLKDWVWGFEYYFAPHPTANPNTSNYVWTKKS